MRPAAPRARRPLVAGAAALQVMAALAWPAPALALLQTDNDRTPTWLRFRVRAQGAEENGVYLGMAAFCRFPEQYPPKRPNPRWETERPSRMHFVEHFNPAFDGCFLKPYLSLPQFTDFHIPAELSFEFEKQLPAGFAAHRSGQRMATLKANLATSAGRRFPLPDLTGSPDQQVTLRLSIFGKPMSTIAFRVDRQYTLRFQEYDRASDDSGPALRRDWKAP